jgi:hypothetical protein
MIDRNADQTLKVAGKFEQSLCWFYSVGDDKKRRRDLKTDRQESEDPETPIRCRRCEHPITHIDQQTAIQGVFEHTFLNPSGHVFRVGCFLVADGCMVWGEPTLEWTWFAGFQWQVAMCSQCWTHLGWFYLADDGRCFFGLILDALI